MLGAVKPVVRLIGVVVLAALLTDLVIVALLVFVVVRSLAGNAADDPHGYVLIFGVAALLVMVPIAGGAGHASTARRTEQAYSPHSFAMISVTAMAPAPTTPLPSPTFVLRKRLDADEPSWH
jgi:hypothetical protein